MRLRTLATLAVVLALSAPSWAATPVIDTKPALATVDHFVIPRFRAVAAAAAAQAEAWQAFCGTHRNPQALRAAYDKVGEAWSGVEFIRIGPAAKELRVERFNYWLDREDKTGKTLAAMLAGTDPVDANTISTASVAIQGMPALERLLYPDDALAQLSGPDGARRCAVGSAIARNMATIAGTIVSDWTGPDGTRAAMATNKAWGVSFYDSQEAASVLLTDLVSGIEGLKDNKVALVFHDVANPAAPRLAEAARSGRSMKDIARNLESIRIAFDAFMHPATPAQKAQLAKDFADAKTKLDALTATVQDDSAERDKRLAAVQAALDSLSILSQDAQTILPAVTGIQLGFNNLDGD